ncbi:MAG: hypothetical protein J1E40_01245 [Oscillospiraceae bacterium]|nr:hypothetical protein [Oscillospiraceae bacterium]
MTKREFRQKMKCGLGRCITAIDSSNMPKYKPIVLWGCINNIAFDTQCEGSRGIYMHDLAVRFNDDDYFVKPAIDKFLTLPPDADWRRFCHLCDFLQCFASDGNKAARQALKEKYIETYSALMNTRVSRKANNICDNYEYLCIDMIQIMKQETFCKIAEDIGGYFSKHRSYNNADLKWRFEWFYIKSCEKFGKKKIRKELEKRSCDSENILCFFEVMEYSVPENKQSAKAVPISAYETVERAETGLSMKDIISARRSEDNQKAELARAVISENDPEKKAELLKIFRSSYCRFPLDPEPLFEYAGSENENLRAAALDVLCYAEGKPVRDFGKKLLEQEKNTAEGLSMLINNYEKTDKTLLMSSLNNINADNNDNSGWHGVVITILNAAERKGSLIPPEALMYIYENSLCSCCRESVLKIMGRRHILTKELLSECLFDCNTDIREYAKKRLKASG